MAAKPTLQRANRAPTPAAFPAPMDQNSTAPVPALPVAADTSLSQSCDDAPLSVPRATLGLVSIAPSVMFVPALRYTLLLLDDPMPDELPPAELNPMTTRDVSANRNE